MNPQIRLKLSIMMFVQFFIWGSWYVTMGTYLLQNLKFTGQQVALAYTCTGWAAIISPFFVGMIADRFFPAQKVLAVMHIIGGVALYFTTQVESSGIFFCLLMIHTLCYMPTLALVNAISMNQMTDPGKEFPGIRVLGTIGWIVAGLTILMLNKSNADINIEATNTPFLLGVGASAVLAIYSFFLPNTPPKSIGQKATIGDIIGVKALTLLKEPSFAIFFAASVLLCIPLAFYYNFTNAFLNELEIGGVAGKMTMGQMSEIIFLLIMPFFFKRLGVKWMLLVGMLAWATRYALFAFGDNEPILVYMLYGGIILHGVCFDFFFVTGQIYVDQKAPKEIQANAQGFIALATYGVGMLIGTYISGWIVDKYVTGTGIIGGEEVALHNWQNIWLVPCGMAVVIIIAFVLLFKENKQNAQAESVPETAPEPPAE
ncbi:MAG: nucleoside permease [Planctomycetes bacterium]|nr:nucleoside permease [Planctomycetota bacterium]